MKRTGTYPHGVLLPLLREVHTQREHPPILPSIVRGRPIADGKARNDASVVALERALKEKR